MMFNDQYLETIEARLAAVSGDHWEVAKGDEGRLRVEVVWASGQRTELRVMLDNTPAGKADIQFIGQCRSDIHHLLLAVQGEAVLSPEEVSSIETRCRAASPAPWCAFLESDGGMGGCSVIWIDGENDAPDMYLWLGADPASDADFEFVAFARQAIPDLIAAVLGRQ
jgi:hypothetical protein